MPMLVIGMRGLTRNHGSRKIECDVFDHTKYDEEPF